jgi:hypothetical protein
LPNVSYALYMWRWLATGLLLAGAARAGAADGSALFAPTLPDSVGDVSRWAIESGQLESQTESGAYRLYVNPQRLAMYQLMRYRVELRVATSPEEQRRGSAERVAFIRRPGVREPMVCWERLPGEVTAWRMLTANTAEYRLEMSVLMRVLAAHRAQGASTPDR